MTLMWIIGAFLEYHHVGARGGTVVQGKQEEIGKKNFGQYNQW